MEFNQFWAGQVEFFEFDEFSIDSKRIKKLIESLSIHIGSGGLGVGHLVRGSKNIAPFNVDREAFDEFF